MPIIWCQEKSLELRESDDLDLSFCFFSYLCDLGESLFLLELHLFIWTMETILHKTNEITETASARGETEEWKGQLLFRI